MKIAKLTIILILIILMFTAIYSYFSISTIVPLAEKHDGQTIFSWPDAMANNFFIEQYIKTGEFKAQEPYNVSLNDVIHPRSMTIVNHHLVPMSFIGMLILYGWLGKIITANYIFLLTPIFSALAGLFFYGIIKLVFDKTIALISLILFLSLGAYCYYANLAMMHTTLFIFLLLGGIYFFLKSIESEEKNKDLYFPILAGLFIGFALITRLIEFVWVGIALLIPFFAYLRKFNFYQLVLFVLFLTVPIGTMMYYNDKIYNEPITLGYLKMGQTDESVQIIDRVPNEFDIQAGESIVNRYLKLVFVPFGFHPKMIWLNFTKYLLVFIMPYMILGALGLLLFIIYLIKRKIPKRQIVFFITSVLVSAYLIIYYGSWEFIDSLVLKHNTIGSSYTRYWLPIQILVLPYIGFLLAKFSQIKVNNILKYSLVSLVIIYLSLYSFSLCYLTPGDGLFNQQRVIKSYYEQYEKVSKIVEPQAIIISNRADKIFFPKYRVVDFNLDYSIFPRIKEIIGKTPVYYFTLMPDKDINYINERKISELNLKLADPVQIDDQFRIYKLINYETKRAE